MPSEHIVDSIVYSGFNQLGDGYNVSFEKNYVLVSRSDEELGKLEAHLYSDYHSLK